MSLMRAGLPSRGFARLQRSRCSTCAQGRLPRLAAQQAMSSSGMNDDKAAASSTSSRTLNHYSERAEDFWAGTKDHDVSQNRQALLSALQPPQGPAAPGSQHAFDILDLGCGPGRDVKFFTDQGHRVTGLDGCADFVAMAQALVPAATLLQQDLHSLQLHDSAYDGIFANAVLFHVHRPELPRVLRELHAALRPRGVLFASNPRSMDAGDHESHGSDADRRYGHYQTASSWCAACSAAGFEEVTRFYRPPGKPLDQQPWLASVWRKRE